MMLVRNLAESNKAISNVVVSVILIVVAISLIFILWQSTKQLIKSPIETSCLDFISSLVIEKACYLNENEIRIDIKRSFDELNLERIRISFLPSSALWEIAGEKCSDVRVKEEKYGHYRDIVSKGKTFSYVFNMSGLEKQESIEVAAGNNKILCSIAKINIQESC